MIKPYNVIARINSLGGQTAEVTVIDIDNSKPQTTYIVRYNGKKCTAILNPFNGNYYVDDIYGVIQ